MNKTCFLYEKVSLDADMSEAHCPMQEFRSKKTS